MVNHQRQQHAIPIGADRCPNRHILVEAERGGAMPQQLRLIRQYRDGQAMGRFVGGKYHLLWAVNIPRQQCA